MSWAWWFFDRAIFRKISKSKLEVFSINCLYNSYIWVHLKILLEFYTQESTKFPLCLKLSVSIYLWVQPEPLILMSIIWSVYPFIILYVVILLSGTLVIIVFPLIGMEELIRSWKICSSTSLCTTTLPNVSYCFH